MLKKVKKLITDLQRKKQPANPNVSNWRVQDTANLTEVGITHRLHYTQEIRLPLLLISEIQRSGGTFLSQLMDGHPQIHSHPYELKIGRPIKYIWPKLDLAARPEVWWENLKEKHVIVHSRGGYKKAGSGTKEDLGLPFIYSEPLQKKLFVRMASSYPQPPTQRQILDAYVTSYFNGWIDYQGLYRDPATLKYWSGFVPRLTVSEEQCAAYFRDYPDGHLLSVIRNPLSWFASANKHRSFEYKLEESAELWNQASRAALRNLANYPDRVTLLHFDDLVKNTEATMRAVCARIGLDFHPALLKPTFNGFPISANSSFTAGAPGTILKASVERGKELPAASADYLKKHTESTYREALSHTVKAA